MLRREGKCAQPGSVAREESRLRAPKGPGGWLAAEPGHFRVVQGFFSNSGRDAPPEVFDLDRIADGNGARKVGVGDRLGDCVAVGRTGDVADRLLLVVHRFLAQDDGPAVVDGQAPQAAGGPFLRPSLKCSLADEAVLGHLYGECKACLKRVMFGGHVRAPGTVSLFQAERAEGCTSGCDDSERLAGLPKHIPKPLTVFGTCVEFPAQFPDVRQTHCRDRDPTDDNFLGPEVTETVVGEVVVADAADEVASQGTPEPDAARAACYVPNLDPIGG